MFIVSLIFHRKKEKEVIISDWLKEALSFADWKLQLERMNKKKSIGKYYYIYMQIFAILGVP